MDFNSNLEVKVLIRSMNIHSPSELSLKYLSSSRAPDHCRSPGWVLQLFPKQVGYQAIFFAASLILRYSCLLAICTLTKAQNILPHPAYVAAISVRSTTESGRSKRVQLPAVPAMSITIIVNCILGSFHLFQRHSTSERFQSLSLDILTQSSD